MSRRGGTNHPDPRRNQPSPAANSQSSVNAAGSGRGGRSGGGRGSRGGHTVPPPSFVPAPVPVTAASSTAAPVVAGSSSAPIRPSPSPAPATVSTEVLSSEVEKKLTLESTPAAASAPSSQKAVRFPNRPGIGRLGRKIQVRANHFQLQVVDKDLHHYDVSILFCSFVFFFC